MLDSGGRGQPVVAVIYTVPLLCEALLGALEDIVELRAFPARGDTSGLLLSLRPDAIVVDTAAEADAAAAYATTTRTPLVHVLLRERRVTMLGRDGWQELDGTAATPEGIRNVLVGALYGRQEVA